MVASEVPVGAVCGTECGCVLRRVGRACDDELREISATAHQLGMRDAPEKYPRFEILNACALRRAGEWRGEFGCSFTATEIERGFGILGNKTVSFDALANELDGRFGNVTAEEGP